MSNPLLFRGKILSILKSQTKKIRLAKNRNKVLFAVTIVMIGLFARVWNTQSVFYAHASIEAETTLQPLKSPLFEQSAFFAEDDSKEGLLINQLIDENGQANSVPLNILENKINEIVGDSPIREMVPFISKRDERVAGFLVGIARKESSWGEHSPSLNGQDCHNYWGYKGAGESGTALGYACFASAEEAIRVVGDRIEVLVNKDRNTPARMVDTWKCGVSCAGDPGAPGWVATVALYFDKIVG